MNRIISSTITICVTNSIKLLKSNYKNVYKPKNWFRSTIYIRFYNFSIFGLVLITILFRFLIVYLLGSFNNNNNSKINIKPSSFSISNEQSTLFSIRNKWFINLSKIIIPTEI